MQTWNDILDYVKLETGASVNLLEISDDEIVKYLKEQTLPYFSQYVPLKKYVFITDMNLITNYESGQPRYMYKLPIPEDEYIIDIFEVYYGPDSSVLGIPPLGYYDAINLVIANSYINALQSLQPRNTWEFVPPNTMIFDNRVRCAIVVYNTIHSDLNTIRPDLYHIIFKPLCAAQVKLWIAQMRSKFSTLTTSFGTIELNWQEMKQEALQKIAELEQKLYTLPPDKLIEVSI